MSETHPVVAKAKEKLANGQQLDKQDAIGLLKVQVEKKGADFVYQRHDDDDVGTVCLNKCWDDETQSMVPDCIVGHVLCDIYGVAKVPGEGSVGMTLERMGTRGDWTVGAFEALLDAQFRQDSGVPWGRAVDLARESYSPDGD